MATATRISARLDASTQEKLQSLQTYTNKSVAEIISEALDCYYEQMRAEMVADNRKLLELAGLFEGPADLSTRHKEIFGEALDDKFENHR